MRKRANQFVDARDEMEAKLGRISRRLAFLVHETDVWKERFTQFEELTEKLGTEASDLKARIEKEKRESKRLSSVVGEKEKEKENLRASESLSRNTRVFWTLIRCRFFFCIDFARTSRDRGSSIRCSREDGGDADCDEGEFSSFERVPLHRVES